MATVYKIKIEAVSYWVNYTEEELRNKIIAVLHKEEQAQIRLTEVKVKEL